jgi:hypothetical protein
VGSLRIFSESQNPFGIFLGCAEAWEAAWGKALRRIGDFKNHLGFFLNPKIWRFDIRSEFLKLL